jgi:hypothetical protein
MQQLAKVEEKLEASASVSELADYRNYSGYQELSVSGKTLQGWWWGGTLIHRKTQRVTRTQKARCSFSTFAVLIISSAWPTLRAFPLQSSD